MRKEHAQVRWLWALPVLILAAAPALANATEPARSLPNTLLSADEIIEYPGTWEYHWGDSPRDHLGGPSWARPPADPAMKGAGKSTDDFRPCTVPGIPPGRASNSYLWLRTRLEGPSIHDP